MPLDLSTFVRDLRPDATVLFLGAGSSQPSHAPSVARIIAHFSKVFHQTSEGFSLAELSDLIEQKTKDRGRMIAELRKLFEHIRPAGGLLNIPLYPWKALYTTNYDELVEAAYRQRSIPLTVFSSNFDFTVRGHDTTTKYFKLHGTISKDISDGHTTRLILTGTDYSYTEDYREKLFDRLKTDLGDSDLLIVGHSLADPDLKDVINRAIALNAQTFSAGRITLLVYTPDPDRAILYENRGLRVVFGGVDDFFADIARATPSHVLVASSSDDPFDRRPGLRPVSIEVAHEIAHAASDVSRIFNGWSASYADIDAGLTFERSVADQVSRFLRSAKTVFAVIVGASGVGKTTAAREAVLRLNRDGFVCWEHRGDHTLQAADWLAVARDLASSHKTGAILIDDAHEHMHELNELVDGLASDDIAAFKIVATSGRNNWRPRVKTPNLFKLGREFLMSRVDSEEIERLLNLVERKEPIHRLVEDTFAGFSRPEKRRRLVERCEADMFVCMRNIFASESFDDIVLREYADIPARYQDIYRLVAALENAGVRVHRQLAIRLLGIPATAIAAVLEGLMDIVTEYTISDKEHIYGWAGRHPIINEIITKFKFNDVQKVIELFDKVIDCISPTYDIEIRSIRELCNVENGIIRIPDKKVQNRLLRKMMSVAPGERVPRHRLIRNLIETGEFDQAQTEIRIFDKDFGSDGPVARYRINLMVARATRTSGLMREDRVVILEKAREEAVGITQRYQYTPQVFAAFCEVGLELFRLTGNAAVYAEAIEAIKEAESRIGDPQVTHMVRRFERQFAGQQIEDAAAEPD